MWVAHWPYFCLYQLSYPRVFNLTIRCHSCSFVKEFCSMELRGMSRSAVFVTPPSLLGLNKLGSYCAGYIDLTWFLRLVNSMSQSHSWGQKNKIWIWTAVDHFKSGILVWPVREHSAGTFNPVRTVVEVWQCYFHVTDGWAVYLESIPDCELFLRPILHV